MFSIRTGVYETNSSSVHSISISKCGMEPNKMPLKRRKKEDGTFGKYIIGKLGSFGKEKHDYSSQEEKLSYLLTICYLTDGREDLETMMESWAFENLNKMIQKYCDCDGIIVDPKTEAEAAIDHQTRYDYYSLSDFSLDYEEFIFNSYISLHTDSD